MLIEKLQAFKINKTIFQRHLKMAEKNEIANLTTHIDYEIQHKFEKEILTKIEILFGMLNE